MAQSLHRPNRYRPIANGFRIGRCGAAWLGRCGAAWLGRRYGKGRLDCAPPRLGSRASRHWGDWVPIPDLVRFIAVDEQELTAVIRDHAEFFRLYRGRQPPWYVMVVPLACERSRR